MQDVLILRLVDDDRRVLAWARVGVESRGDGGLWATSAFRANADESGTATAMIWHWPDVNVHATFALTKAMEIVQGQVVVLEWTDHAVIMLPSEDAPLPAVTVRSSTTAHVPTGAYYAKDASGSVH